MEQQMQAKLDDYRIRKRRRQRLDELKSKFRRFLMLGTGIGDDTKETIIKIEEIKPILPDEQLEEEALPFSSDEEGVAENNHESADKEEEDNKLLKYTLRVVYVLFWTTLFVIAIELKFGVVFLMFSALIGIYFNTRTGPRKKNEISAYSVFNKNCESIDGTLKAEQFEREIRYGAGSVKH